MIYDDTGVSIGFNLPIKYMKVLIRAEEATEVRYLITPLFL
jgi:hypothetical protein